MPSGRIVQIDDGPSARRRWKTIVRPSGDHVAFVSRAAPSVSHRRPEPSRRTSCTSKSSRGPVAVRVPSKTRRRPSGENEPRLAGCANRVTRLRPEPSESITHTAGVPTPVQKEMSSLRGARASPAATTARAASPTSARAGVFTS